MGMGFNIVILAQKRNRAKFLLHIFGPLSTLWLMASKRTFVKISLRVIRGHSLVFSLLSKGGKGATYLVSGRELAPLGVCRNDYSTYNEYND